MVDAVSQRPLNEDEQKLLRTCHEVLTELLVREPRNNEKQDNILRDLQEAAAAVEAEGGDESEPKKPRKGGQRSHPTRGILRRDRLSPGTP